MSRPAKVLTLLLLLPSELRRRLAGDLSEGMGKRRHAGIAQIGGKLLHRQAGIDRQPLDGGGNASAQAPALEGKLRLGRKQPRQRPRRGADRARQRLDLVGGGGVGEHDIGGAAAARLLWYR